MKKILPFLVLALMSALSVLADDVKMEAVVNHTVKTELSTYSYGRITSFTLGEGMKFAEVYNDGNIGFLNSDCVATYGDGTLFVYKNKMSNYSGNRQLDEVRFTKYTRSASGSWTGNANYKVVGKQYENAPMFMAFDPQSKTLYGFRNGEEMKTVVFTINQETGEMTEAFLLDRYYNSFAINAFGEAYATNYQGEFYKVDMKAHKGTKLGKMANSNDDSQLLAFDNASGRLFMGYRYSDKHSFYEINLSDGTSTSIGGGPSDDYLICLLGTTEANQEAPAAPSQLKATYTVPGQKTAVLSAVAPTKKFDQQTALEGTVDLVFSVDGTAVGTATGVAPGATGSVEYTFAEEKEYKVSVLAQNTHGPSAVISETTFAGFDTPEAPKNVYLTIDADGNYTLTWDAPAKGEKNGAIDTANLKYNVRAYPIADSKDNLTDTQVSGKVTGRALNDYYFTVEAFTGSKTSQLAESNHVVWGTGVDLPYEEDFTKTDNFTLYTVYDENQDGYTWGHSYGVIGDSQTFLYSGYKNGNSTSQEAKDWFIMPAVRMNKGAVYTVDFSAYSAYWQTDVNHLALYWLSSTDPISATKTLIQDFQNIPDYTKGGTVEGESSKYSAQYEAKADGIGYFALLCHSAAGKRVFLDDFRISSTSGSSAPLDVADFELEPTEPGSYTFDVSFTAPTKDKTGKDLTTIDRIALMVDDVAEPLKEFYDVAPGSEQEFQFTYSTTMRHTFKLFVFTDAGQSEGAQKTIWVGEDLAREALNLHGYIDEDGDIVLEWDENKKSLNGYYVNWDNLTYNVYAATGEGGMTLVKAGVKETTCTLDGSQFGSSSQQQYTFWVIPMTSSDGVVNNTTAYYFMAYGPAVTLPFYERFGVYEHDQNFWSTMEVRYDEVYYNEGWKCVSNGYSKKVITAANSVDLEDGFEEGTTCLAQFHQTRADWYKERIVSPTISIKNAEQPVLTYWMYHTSTMADDTQMLVELYDMHTGKYITVDTQKANSANGWVKHEVDLTEQMNAGHTLFRLSFQGQAKAGEAFYMDCPRIVDMAAEVGITTIDADAATANRAFNLAGQRISDNMRGIQIVGGKKIIK